MSKKIATTGKNGQTETRTYETGKYENIQHTDNKAGNTHEHNVCHGGLLGTFGPFTGTSRTVKSSAKSGKVSKTTARSAVNSVAKSRGKK